jgi:hypothetical protein
MSKKNSMEKVIIAFVVGGLIGYLAGFIDFSD